MGKTIPLREEIFARESSGERGSGTRFDQTENKSDRSVSFKLVILRTCRACRKLLESTLTTEGLKILFLTNLRETMIDGLQTVIE